MKEYKYIINGKEFSVTVGERKGGVTTVNVNGEMYNVAVVPEPTKEKKVVVKKPVVATDKSKKNDLQDALVSPLPGTIVEIPSKVGQDIKEGDCLIVLEAMKMNNSLTAEKDGKIKAILVEEGDVVKENTPLVTFE